MRNSLATVRTRPGPAEYNTMRSSFDGTDKLGDTMASWTQGKQNTYRLNDGHHDPVHKGKFYVPGPGTYENPLDELS